jgi:hypothetical protein
MDKAMIYHSLPPSVWSAFIGLLVGAGITLIAIHTSALLRRLYRKYWLPPVPQCAEYLPHVHATNHTDDWWCCGDVCVHDTEGATFVEVKPRKKRVPSRKKKRTTRADLKSR